MLNWHQAERNLFYRCNRVCASVLTWVIYFPEVTECQQLMQIIPDKTLLSVFY